MEAKTKLTNFTAPIFSTMIIKKNTSLKPYNTFGVDVKSKLFVEFSDIDTLQNITQDSIFTREKQQLILGGGSNLLFTKDFDGIVLKNNLKGIELLNEDDNYYYVRCQAGEVWHNFVLTCIEHNWAGLENLSLIPGNVGASPMQNIGAYGIEIKDRFDSLEALHIESGEIKTFDNKACKFGYRESVFKTIYKNQFIILSVTYKLLKTPKINTSYGAIEQELEKMGVSSPTIKNVSDAVIAIRSSKLPNPKEIGNAGSFFKNPVVSEEQKNKVLNNHPDAPNYPQQGGTFKLAAGWLIEQAGWKGKTIDERYGVHKKQALVLVNYGNSTGREIYNLSEEIIASVKEKFGITLEREVNIY